MRLGLRSISLDQAVRRPFGRARCTDRQTLRDDLKYSSFDGFLSNVVVGAGETFFPAFALALGSTETSSGLIAALPFMIGSSLQLKAFRGLQACGSYRKWVVMMCALQALCFFPLIAIAFHGPRVPAWVLYSAVTLYWSTGLAAGPAWSAWLATLVPREIRPRFFAYRSRVGQLGVVVGMLFAGSLLQIATHNHFELYAFACIFLIAGLARLGSVIYLGRHSERPTAMGEQRSLRGLQAFSAMLSRRRGQGRLFRFLMMFSVSVYIASPFFNAFMLKRLQLNYAAYMGLVVASIVARLLVLKYFGARRSRASEPLRLMRYGLIGAGLSPLLWLISSNYVYLLAIQAFSGLVWSVYELGLMLSLYSVVRDEERASVMSIYNFATAATILTGTMIGGSLLSYFGESRTAYFIVFTLSAGLRLLALIPFRRATRVLALELTREVSPTNLPDFERAAQGAAAAS